MKTVMTVVATLWIVAISGMGYALGTEGLELGGAIWGVMFGLAACLTLHMGWWFGRYK